MRAPVPDLIGDDPHIHQLSQEAFFLKVDGLPGQSPAMTAERSGETPSTRIKSPGEISGAFVVFG
jgi:hypothetical protein